MFPEVVSVRPLGGHLLRVRFDDGAEGEIDLARHLDFVGVFAPLKDPAYVARVRIVDDGATIGWPSSGDIDPVMLYYWATGRKLVDFEA